MKYLCYYAPHTEKNVRKSMLSATNKIDYILAAIREIDDNPVEIISRSESAGEHFLSKEIAYTDNGERIVLFSTFGKKNVICKLIDKIFLPVQVCFYLLRNTKKQDTVICYHSTQMAVIKITKKLIGYKLILEMEEIYGDVSNDKGLKKREMKFSKLADAFLFPTELLNEKVNNGNKPYAIIHGTYQVELDRKRNIFCENLQNTTKKIHCVYAGTFDPRKGGAIAAAAAAEYLPENYHIHILGFGSEADKKNMQKMVEKLTEKCACSITYDGLLSGEEYIQFIQSCDIGLCTQNPNAAFNATSFPSKILSYMANGLRVVSIRIPAIEGSSIGTHMYYYDQQTPEEIAKSIMRVDMNDAYDGRSIIEELDEEFKKDLKSLLAF